MSKYLFVTGRLAESALRKTLSAMDLIGGYRVEVLGISVASLMSTKFIARHLRGVQEEVIVIPGLCNGPTELIAQSCRCSVLKGPEDLKELPLFFGVNHTAQAITEPSLTILAEIVDAPRMTVSDILKRAAYYKANGAGIIDIGTDVYGEFSHLPDAVRALKDEGYLVSIDSLTPKHILAAVDAGADMVLSINSSNIDVSRDLDCTLVVIPDENGDLLSLFTNMQQLLAQNKRIAVDPILPPLMFGFAEGIVRYATVRRQFPLVPMLMGSGNVTELADADSTGMNAIVVGIATELKVNYLLTTECSPRTRWAVKEVDIARRLMHTAEECSVLPKRLDDSLLTVKDPSVPSYTTDELHEIQSLVTDKNYRIFIDDHNIHIFNAHTFISDHDAKSLFTQLHDVDPPHAFYLGKELYKAELALRLGKKYVQDCDLRWGYLNKT